MNPDPKGLILIAPGPPGQIIRTRTGHMYVADADRLFHNVDPGDEHEMRAAGCTPYPARIVRVVVEEPPAPIMHDIAVAEDPPTPGAEEDHVAEMAHHIPIVSS